MAFSGRAPEGYDLNNSGVDHTRIETSGSAPLQDQSVASLKPTMNLSPFPSSEELNNREQPQRIGIASPRYMLFFFFDLAIIFIVGKICHLIALGLGDNAGGYQSIKSILAAIGYYSIGLIASLFWSKYSLFKYQVRNGKVIIIVSVLYGSAFMLGNVFLQLQAFSISFDFSDGVILLLKLICIFAFISLLVLVSLSNFYRVHYCDGEIQDWAAIQRVFFKPKTASHVLDCLIRHDRDSLQGMMVIQPGLDGGPKGKYTELIIFTNRNDPDSPMYLTMKDFSLTLGGVMLDEIYMFPGSTLIDRRLLRAGEVQTLLNLLPCIQRQWGGQRPSWFPPIALEGEVEIVFDETLKTPIGLPDKAPTLIKKANGTFIQALSKKQYRQFKYIANGDSIAVFICVVLVFSIIGIMSLLESVIENNIALTIISILSIITLIFGSIGYVFVSALIAKKIMKNSLLSQSDVVTNFDQSETKYLFVEETATYSKMKFFPDDAIVMTVNEKGIGIEGSKFRTWMNKEDVELSYEKINSLTKERSLRIDCHYGEYKWSIVARPVLNSITSTFTNKDKASNQLWQEIYDALNSR